MNYIKQRLREPGSIRSLAIVLFAAKALIPASWGIELVSVEQTQDLLNSLIFMLGGYSFLKPETPAAPAVPLSPADLYAAWQRSLGDIPGATEPMKGR